VEEGLRREKDGGKEKHFLRSQKIRWLLEVELYAGLDPHVFSRSIQEEEGRKRMGGTRDDVIRTTRSRGNTEKIKTKKLRKKGTLRLVEKFRRAVWSMKSPKGPKTPREEEDS